MVVPLQMKPSKHFSSLIQLSLFKPVLPDRFSKQSLGPSSLPPLSGLSLPSFFLPLFLLSPSLYFLTKARSGKHMIRPPLIGIRFTGFGPAPCWLEPKHCSHLHREWARAVLPKSVGPFGPPPVSSFRVTGLPSRTVLQGQTNPMCTHV